MYDSNKLQKKNKQTQALFFFPFLLKHAYFRQRKKTEMISLRSYIPINCSKFFLLSS